MSLLWMKAITHLRLRRDFAALNLGKRKLKVLHRKSMLDLILEILSNHSIASDQSILCGQKLENRTGFENFKSLSRLQDISRLWWWKERRIHLSALGIRSKGCPIPDICTSGMRRVKNKFCFEGSDHLHRDAVHCVICIFSIPWGSRILTRLRSAFQMRPGLEPFHCAAK